MDKPPTHETQNELEFIRTIGSHSLHTRRISRTEMLKRYLVGCEQRTNWMSIDKEKVMEFARTEMGVKAAGITK